MREYEIIEKAIIYLKDNFQKQPQLEEIAHHVNLSSFHFHRMFKKWAGVSPKKFLQFLSIEYAKGLLKQNVALSKASWATGLSGSGRLHDLFLGIEGMTPGEYKDGGKSLMINYNFAETPFGRVIIATTLKGVCHISFTEEGNNPLDRIQNEFPKAHFVQQSDEIQREALTFFTGDWKDLHKVRLHLKATSFQLKVWQSLLQIPFGSLTTYGSIADTINMSGASRAVGSAVGKNPVAFLIPCHRVIKSSGFIGEYHWGSNRKVAIISWEAARSSTDHKHLKLYNNDTN